VKVVSDLSGTKHANATAQLLVERPGESFGLEGATVSRLVARQIDVDDLVKGVHPGVGTPRSYDHGFVFEAKHVRERRAQFTDHRRELGLIGEA
jgi:hypothetical protein